MVLSRAAVAGVRGGLALAGRQTLRSAPTCRAAVPVATLNLARRWKTGYAKSHEYIKIHGDDGTVGITDFAAAALGDVVYVELPEVGATFSAGETFGSVESVKAASDVYAPVSGEVVEVNSALSDTPSLVNSSAMDDGWFIKLKVSSPAEADSLMDHAAYKKLCDESKK